MFAKFFSFPTSRPFPPAANKGWITGAEIISARAGRTSADAGGISAGERTPSASAGRTSASAETTSASAGGISAGTGTISVLTMTTSAGRRTTVGGLQTMFRGAIGLQLAGVGGVLGAALVFIAASQSVLAQTPGIVSITLTATGTSALSRDGSTVVGRPMNSPYSARRWTALGGLGTVGPISPYASAIANATNVDGSRVLMAQYDSFGVSENFIWTPIAASAIPQIPRETSASSLATPTLSVMAATTGAVAGTFDETRPPISGSNSVTFTRGVVWTGSSFVKLDSSLLFTFASGQRVFQYHKVLAISDDGSVVVGSTKRVYNLGDEPCFWVNGTGPVFIDLPAGFTSGQANDVSADGKVIVGEMSPGPVPFRWTSAGGTQRIGPTSGFGSVGRATATNSDGSVVVGNESNFVAWYWRADLGLRSVSVVMNEVGLSDSAPGFGGAVDISADGRTVLGQTGNQGSIARVLTLGPCFAISPPPQDTLTCRLGSAPYSIAASGPGPHTYQWQVESAPGIWQTMGGDPGPLSCGGGATAYATPIDSPNVTIGITPCPGDITTPQHFQIRCLVTNACGTVTSDEATYTICPADFDCSGGLSVQDIFAFLNGWFAGNPAADFNGNGISVQDIFEFLNAWFVGC